MSYNNYNNLFIDDSEIIDIYKKYCDEIHQFYKKFNIKDDIKFQEYIRLNSESDKIKFINKLKMDNRNDAIDSILY